MSKRPTATYFRPHLLVALGQLSGFKYDVPLAREAVIKAVLERLQMDENALGTKHGKLETHRLIGLAFRGVRTLAVPLTSSPGKNLWALTNRGVAEAAKLASPTTPTPDPPKSVEQKIASLSNPYDDPYLREIAIVQSPCHACYGILYDAKEAICQSCPVASFCRDALHEAYRQAALAENPEPQKPKPPEESEAESTPLIHLTPEQIREAVLTNLKSMASPLCQMCGKNITDKQCMFVQPLGAFHLKCWPD